MPHRGIEPASAAYWSDALPTELLPYPIYKLRSNANMNPNRLQTTTKNRHKVRKLEVVQTQTQNKPKITSCLKDKTINTYAKIRTNHHCPFFFSDALRRSVSSSDLKEGRAWRYLAKDAELPKKRFSLRQKRHRRKW